MPAFSHFGHIYYDYHWFSISCLSVFCVWSFYYLYRFYINLLCYGFIYFNFLLNVVSANSHIQYTRICHFTSRKLIDNTQIKIDEEKKFFFVWIENWFLFTLYPFFSSFCGYKTNETNLMCVEKKSTEMQNPQYSWKIKQNNYFIEIVDYQKGVFISWFLLFA